MPKKNNSLSIILIVVSLSCIALCAIGGFFVFQSAKGLVGQVSPMISCSINMTMVRDALNSYAMDKGAYPQAATWMDDVQSYLKEDKEVQELKKQPIFKYDPLDPQGAWGCKASETIVYGFAYNAEMAGKKPADIANKRTTVVVFETKEAPKRNLAMPYKEIKEKAEPKIMGENRSFMVGFIDGDIDTDIKSEKGAAKTEIKIN